jgi:hypothetical protein
MDGLRVDLHGGPHGGGEAQNEKAYGGGAQNDSIEIVFIQS